MSSDDNNSPLAAKDATVHVKSTDDGESWYEVASVDAEFGAPDMEPVTADWSTGGEWTAACTFEDIDEGAFDELIEQCQPVGVEVDYMGTTWGVLALHDTPIDELLRSDCDWRTEALAELAGGVTVELQRKWSCGLCGRTLPAPEGLEYGVTCPCGAHWYYCEGDDDWRFEEQREPYDEDEAGWLL